MVLIHDSLQTVRTSRFGRSSTVEIGVAASLSDSLVNKMVSQRIKTTGDDFAAKKQYNRAIKYYQKAIETSPDHAAPYYHLAKVYEKTGKPYKAIKTYEQLLAVKPDEIEARTLTGNIYKENGDFRTARQMFRKAFEANPKYDFAARSLKEIDYLILAQDSPMQAEAMKQETAKKNLSKALKLFSDYAPPVLLEKFNELNVTFGETDSLSGHKNIAQYENRNKRIVITDEYIWAAPEVVAAYIVHEAVHARDRDSLSSIREEQDAYQSSVEFWVTHNNGIEDPELDYAAELYKKTPDDLRQRVGETYSSRDGNMPLYSPHHTPYEGVGFIEGMKMKYLQVKNSILDFLYR